MVEIKLDITNKVCPFCLLLVKKMLVTLNKEDILIVKCDHPPAATDTIPYAMEKANYPCETKKLEPGLWELRIIKK
ncbi:MAG: sulfurtransferase TusA family protein [Promethearchaeota archaeon]